MILNNTNQRMIFSIIMTHEEHCDEELVVVQSCLYVLLEARFHADSYAMTTTTTGHRCHFFPLLSVRIITFYT